MKNTKTDKTEYICFYVLKDGKPKTLMNSLFANNMAEAMAITTSWFERMFKKAGEPFEADSISSLTIMPKPKRGRPKKRTSEAV